MPSRRALSGPVAKKLIHVRLHPLYPREPLIRYISAILDRFGHKNSTFQTNLSSGLLTASTSWNQGFTSIAAFIDKNVDYISQFSSLASTSSSCKCAKH